MKALWEVTEEQRLFLQQIIDLEDLFFFAGQNNNDALAALIFSDENQKKEA